MKRECNLCGKEYSGGRKQQHVEDSHRKEAYDYFEGNYIKNDNFCLKCDRFFEGNKRTHTRNKHSPFAFKIFVQDFYMSL
jgi:hypothetical protein